jgi:hypothetical protein|tara:strand:+ start:1733 stop:2101 length:369 start_codon:yes stop_codon:yes gene_type:complete
MDDIFIPDLNFDNSTLSHHYKITNGTLTNFYFLTISGISLIFYLINKFIIKRTKILKFRKIFTKNKINLDDSNICSICLEKDNLITLKCKHNFHEKCIGKWMENNYNCPLCRMNYSNYLENF